MRMIDFPGLVSPQVVRIRREKKLDRVTTIREIKPDWVVLRFVECEWLARSGSAAAFEQNDDLKRTFNVNEQLDRYRFRPG